MLDGYRAVGQLLLVGPQVTAPDSPVLFGDDDPEQGHAVLAPLADAQALLVTAVAPTSSALRQLLDQAYSSPPVVQSGLRSRRR